MDFFTQVVGILDDPKSNLIVAVVIVYAYRRWLHQPDIDRANRFEARLMTILEALQKAAIEKAKDDD